MRSPMLPGLLLASLVAGCAGSGTDVDAKAEPKAEPAEAEPEQTEPAADADTAGSDAPAKTYVQQWATPSGQPTAMLRTIAEGRALVIAGPYMEFGTPATHLLSLSLAEGQIEWDYEAEAPIAISALSPELVEIVVDGPPLTIDLSSGKQVRPKKAQSDALEPIPKTPTPECTVDGSSLDCGTWKVEEAGDLAILTLTGESICYATAVAREVRCRTAASGELELVIRVPAVPDAKHPEAVNFDYKRASDQIIIANYDGTVLAFGPG